MFPAFLLALQQPDFDFDVTSGGGLTITVSGTPIVRGSYFQYYEPGWTKGYYSSLNSGQKIEKVGTDTIRLSYSENLSSGQAVFRRQGNRVTADYEFSWSGDSPVLVEAGSLVWAPAFQSGILTAAGQRARSLKPMVYDQSGLEARRFAVDSGSYLLDSPFAKVAIQSDSLLTFFDARGYDQPWAVGTQVWWLGTLGLSVTKSSPGKLRMEWQIEPKTVSTPAPKTIQPETIPIKAARVPDEGQPLLIPKPKTNQLDYTKPVVLSGRYTYPLSHAMYMGDFTQALTRRFILPKPNPKAKSLAVDSGVSKLGLKPGGYRITITKDSISVLGEEDAGLHNAWRRLAQIVFVKGGKLWLPTGILLDSPSVDWRGVHLFVGPDARGFQRKLWERVLLPMGYNHVVLQCERTDWKSTPGIATGMTTSKNDLKAIFDSYRNWGVDPIPLVQSWGHMEWLFANDKNRNLRFNPNSNYSIDPRKPEARKQVESIWDEAIALLKPETIHVGLDEVDMIGWPDDKELVTTIWEDYLPFLSGIAKKNKVRMMLWGDELLAPGEAIDAPNAGTPQLSERRRNMVPKGSYIGDWHYSGEPRPDRYYKSLDLLKSAGFNPVASAWYEPKNIQGFGIAAQIEKVGYLQTTWAGYESNEQSLVENLPQFAAMVLAAEYVWGGSYEAPTSFGYDPVEQFRRMYFSTPSPLTPQPGLSVKLGIIAKPVTIGDIGFNIYEPIGLASSLLGNSGASMVTVPLKGKGRSLWLAVDAQIRANDREPIAEVEATLANGKKAVRFIRYGQDVRSTDDKAATSVAPRSGALSAVRLGLATDIVSLRIRATNTYAGLRIHGITVMD